MNTNETGGGERIAQLLNGTEERTCWDPGRNGKEEEEGEEEEEEEEEEWKRNETGM